MRPGRCAMRTRPLAVVGFIVAPDAHMSEAPRDRIEHEWFI